MIAPFLSDGHVLLRPVQRDDLRLLADWRNQPEIRLRTREWRPLTMPQQERWFGRITSEETKDWMFVVVVPAGLVMTMVGVVGLCHWSPVDRTAEVSFYLGNADYERRGIMKDSLRLLHEWGWLSLGLERIWAEAYAFNERSIGILKKLGYREEGRLRSHVYRDGRRWDSVMLGLLREEWWW